MDNASGVVQIAHDEEEYGRFLSAIRGCRVSAVTLKPSLWNETRPCPHQGNGFILVMDGARETKMDGAAIFPEILRSEFHEIRSVIKAYSEAAKIEGLEEPHAAGIMFDSNQMPWHSANLRVTSNGQSVRYKLDRCD